MKHDQLAQIRARVEEGGYTQLDAALLLAEVERMRAENAAMREIVDALAHEATYQAETGEGSTAYLARLVKRAHAWLDEHEAV